MKPNKKLDRLFQEKLKDLEVTPPDIVWDNIEAQLNEKNKKRVLPLWWKTAGAAAIILSIATGGFYFLNTPSNSIPVESTITNTAIDSIKEKKNTTSPDLILIPLENQNTIVDSKKSSKEQFKNNATIDKESTPSETITTTETQSELDKLFNETATSKTGNVEQIALTNGSDQTKTNTTNNTSSKKGKFQFIPSKEPILSNNNKGLGVSNQFNVSPLELIQQKQTNKDWTLNSNSEKPENTSSTSIAQNASETNTNLENSSLNPISDLNNSDKDEIPEEGSSLNQKWTVASVIAPVFYNSFNSKGSPMGDQFESNPKQGSNSIAYGIKVGYKIGKKLSLQSGLSIMDVGFSVNEVYMNPTGLTVAKLSNVNYSSSAKFINVNATKEISSLRPSEITISEPLEGSLSQEYGYIEVPLELKYNLIDGKFRAHVITGFSTLILNGNEVYVENSEFSSNLGEANNLNDVNFSGNFGLDFDYSINKNLFINVAPIFKVYGNTFSNNTDDFEPYAIGIYTGINYRFD